VFSLVGDISKAHRRFLHAPGELSLLACRILESDPHICINKVGTFGLVVLLTGGAGLQGLTSG
jgi:hypothetical protein